MEFAQHRQHGGKIAGAVRWCAAEPFRGLPEPVDPAGEMLRGGRRDGGLQLPLQRSGLHGVEAVMRTPLPGQNGETVRIAQQVVGRHGRAEGRRHPDAAVLPLGRAVRTGKAQRLMQKLQIEIGLIAPQGESSRDGIEILRGEAVPRRLRLQIIVGRSHIGSILSFSGVNQT